MADLANAAAIVTGGNSQLGFAIASALHGAGAAVVRGVGSTVDGTALRALRAFRSATQAGFLRWCLQKCLLGPCWAVAAVSPVTDAITRRPAPPATVTRRTIRRERKERTRNLCISLITAVARSH